MSDGKTYIASLSYGKDSIAMLHVITDVLHWPLDRIVTADVWATDTIPAELPPMVEFKKYADEEIKKRWGIEVEHFCARNKDGSKRTFEGRLNAPYNHTTTGIMRLNALGENGIYGFPSRVKNWCNSQLKVAALNKAKKSVKNSISYIGIAVDEPNRFHNLNEIVISPLVEAEWTEQMCREWCEENNLLSPIYTSASRGGCWFCHNQGIDQLRQLRHNYPELWAMLMKWDNDSPVTFHTDGHTVHDFDRRFRWEDEGYLPQEKYFRWADVEFPQMNICQLLKEGEENDID